MAEFVMTDCTTWFAGYDMTTDLNKLSVKVEVEDKERTTFGNTYKTRVGGLRDFSADLEGYWQAGAGLIDNEAFASLGMSDRVITFSPTGQVGSVAYLGQVGSFNYELFGQVGDVTPFVLNTRGTGRYGLVRGQVAKAKSTVSGTGVMGSAVNLGPVQAGEYLYASVHVFSAGTTVTMKIESDDSSGFGSPTDVVTLQPITTSGGTWVTRQAGPITDTYFRFNVTAITGSFVIAAAIGIGS